MISPIFGVEIKEPNQFTKDKIQQYVREYPVEVFGQLNKALNNRGYALTFDSLEAEEEDG